MPISPCQERMAHNPFSINSDKEFAEILGQLPVVQTVLVQKGLKKLLYFRHPPQNFGIRIHVSLRLIYGAASGGSPKFIRRLLVALVSRWAGCPTHSRLLRMSG